MESLPFSISVDPLTSAIEVEPVVYLSRDEVCLIDSNGKL